MNEIWKDIEGYPNYQISNLGKIKNKYNNHILNGKTNHKGYKVVTLNKKDLRVHRLVASTFIPNPENKPFIDHINTDKTDNRVENLRWVTNKENMNNPLTLKKYHKSVIQFSNDGTFIKKWNNIRDVENELGFDHSGISSCCRGKQKTAGGFVWGYNEDYEQIKFNVFDLTIFQRKVA